MEEFGIFLICAVVGYATVRLSFVLKHKLHGSFDEVLPNIIILGGAVLYLGYGVAPLIEQAAQWLEVKVPRVNLNCPANGLFNVMSARDVDAVLAALVLAFFVAKLVDLGAVMNFVRKNQTLSFGQIFTRPRLVASRYERYLLSQIINKEGDDFQKLQLDAVRRKNYVLVTLSSQRIYYGISAFEARHPALVSLHGSFRQLQLTPLLSGYRDNEERKVHLTDTHPPTFKKILPNRKNRIKSSMIEIPYSQIVSIQFVDISFLLKNAIKSPEFLSALKPQGSNDPNQKNLPGI